MLVDSLVNFKGLQEKMKKLKKKEKRKDEQGDCPSLRNDRAMSAHPTHFSPYLTLILFSLFLPLNSAPSIQFISAASVVSVQEPIRLPTAKQTMPETSP